MTPVCDQESPASFLDVLRGADWGAKLHTWLPARVLQRGFPGPRSRIVHQRIEASIGECFTVEHPTQKGQLSFTGPPSAGKSRVRSNPHDVICGRSEFATAPASLDLCRVLRPGGERCDQLGSAGSRAPRPPRPRNARRRAGAGPVLGDAAVGTNHPGCSTFLDEGSVLRRHAFLVAVGTALP